MCLESGKYGAIVFFLIKTSRLHPLLSKKNMLWILVLLFPENEQAQDLCKLDPNHKSSNQSLFSTNCTFRPNPIAHFYPNAFPWPLAIGTESHRVVVEVYLYEMGRSFKSMSSVTLSSADALCFYWRSDILSCCYVACVGSRRLFAHVTLYRAGKQH